MHMHTHDIMNTIEKKKMNIFVHSLQRHCEVLSQ